MKDKEFKAKNRDESYVKDSAPDIRLGRHGDLGGQTPQQSVRHRNRIYQSQQPAGENTAVISDAPYSAETENIPVAERPQTEPQNTELQNNNSHTVHQNENTDLQNTQMSVHKNRFYRQHTEFAQKSADYDFTKENQTADYSFTSEPEPYSTDTTEQPENTADEISDNAERIINNDVPRSESPKTSHKKYYRHQNPRPSKGADFDFTESAKAVDYDISDISRNEEYNFNNKISDIPFTRSQKTDGGKNADKVKKRRAYKNGRTDAEITADSANTRKEASEPKQDEDYNISKALENSDTAFDRVADADKTETTPTAKRKKNKRLQQKQRLRTDDTIPTEPAADKSETAQSEHSAENTSKDYQFKRAEKAEFKAKKARDKADKAEKKLPHKKKIKSQRLYDEEKQKPKTRLQFEKEVKPQKDLYHRTPIKTAASAVGAQLANKAHSKVSEVEYDNSAVEGAHKTERAAETLTRYSVRTERYAKQHIKGAPYRKAQRLRFKAEKAEVNAMYQRTLAEKPELKKSILKKFRKKQQIKKHYQKMKQVERNAKTVKKTAQATEKTMAAVVNFVRRHKKAFAVILIIALVVCWLATTISSCAVMGTSGINSILTSSYFSEDEDIYMAEGYYTGLETNLQTELDNIETYYSGYDEYNYNLAQIGHNPYELISYLTAKYECFVFADIETELDTLFTQQYVLTLTEEIEILTDGDGNEYEYKILNITLINNNLNTLANTNLTDDQRELYGIYLETKGNRDYLFADDIYSNAVTPPSYTIPGEALSDSTFRTLITEAEKYLGYPYVWGGSSPSTSFDCSGFVCWVFKNSGVYPLERTTAQGIFNQCAVISRADAKPGDIIFFTGTYSTSDAVTHVGIYVGDGMMIHCGSPIQYASIDSSYWSSHFYAFGRLGS